MKSQAVKDLTAKASNALAQCFLDVPFCTLQLSGGNARPGSADVDIIGKIRTKDKEITILVETRSSGQPRFVRDAINALARYQTRFENAYGVFVAPFISEESAEILSAENVGYVDFAGNCRICVDGIYLREKGNVNRFTRKRDLRSLYSPKGERILRTLMVDPKRTWKVKPLAEEAQVSLGQVSNIKKLLEAREWLCPKKQGFIITDPEKLLNEWSSHYSYRRHRITEFYSLSSLTEIEQQIAGKVGASSYGTLTGFSAAARLAPSVRYQRASAFVREASETVAAALGWKAVSSGGNVSLLEPYDAGVFLGCKEIDGVEIVSPVQIYLDLQATAGRGEEAAQALLREVLQPSW